MTQLKLVKAEKHTQTNVDTIEITEEVVKEWALPPFQRPIKANAKVLALAEELKENGGVFPGIITIGILKGKKYLADGQHRCHAFTLSGLEVGYSDVRYRTYETMADMADDFVQLNSSLVKMRPDDIMRGLESSSESLSYLKKNCPAIGYDQIRRGSTSPMISMSALLRCWFASARDVPGNAPGSSTDLVKMLSMSDAEDLAGFLNLAVSAWGRDPEYWRLYSNLNLTLCMWIYRNCAMRPWSARMAKIGKGQFKSMLIALSADTAYLEWLQGRNMSERDRSPCYRRIKTAFTRSLESDTGKKVTFPAPEWVAH
jgi:hypothetical protein